jgi:NADH:ubiquinone oxidoreductase subunit 6 (subunit J)
MLVAAGLLFFSMNRGPQPARANFFLRIMHIYPFQERYCDMGTALAWVNDDWNGLDPRRVCPSCPCPLLTFNYGMGVLWLGRLGFHMFSVADKDWLGPIAILSFLLFTAVVVEATKYWHVLYYGLLIFTPAIFLGMERANLDLVLYCCLAAAVLAAARYGDGWGPGVVLFSAMLKFYPIAGLLAFLNRSRRSWRYILAAAGGMVVFLILTFNYLPFGHIAGSKLLSIFSRLAQVPRPFRAAHPHSADLARFSFGYQVIFDLSPPVLRNLGWPALGMKLAALGSWDRFAILAAWCGLSGLAAWWVRRPLALFLDSERSRTRQFFLLGCSIYAFCFVSATNFEYRLIFLLFMAPYLLLADEEKGESKQLLARTGAVLLLLVFVLTWFRDDDHFVLFQQACDWLLLAFSGSMCLAVLFTSLPWGKESSQRPGNGRNHVDASPAAESISARSRHTERSAVRSERP